MTITEPAGGVHLRAAAVLILLTAFSSQSRADSECPGKNSTGCWASACVFTREALFVNGVGKDGFRRAEYVIPEKGRIKYRTLKYLDADCTQVDRTEVSEWLEDSQDFRKLETTTVDDTLIVEQVAFGPVQHGNQGMVTVRGRFYVLEKNLLCTSSNLLYAQDGPAIDFRPSSNPDGATLRESCLHRLTELHTPTSIDLVGTVVPPYPQGFDSFEGVCIPDEKNPGNVCAYTIAILQASRDDERVAIFAGAYDHREGDFIHWRVTDQIEYPDVPEGHAFAQVGCELNGVEDEATIAVLEPNQDRGMGPVGLSPAIWARRLDVARGKLVEVDPKSVKCQHEGFPEGVAP